MWFLAQKENSVCRVPKGRKRVCAGSVSFFLSTPDLEQTQVGASSSKPSTALVLWVPSVFSHIIFHSLVQDKILQGTLCSLGLLPREVLTMCKAPWLSSAVPLPEAFRKQNQF